MLGESILSYLVLTIKKLVGHELYFIKQLITWKTLPYSGKQIRQSFNLDSHGFTLKCRMCLCNLYTVEHLVIV